MSLRVSAPRKAPGAITSLKAPAMVVSRLNRAAYPLTVEEDAAGLFYRVTLPDTQIGRDTYTMIKRGDLSGSSFAFTTKTDEWTFPTKAGELPQRRILEVDELMDVSPVTFPAYTASSVQANSREARAHHEYAADVSKGGETQRAKQALDCRMNATACARCGSELGVEARVLGGTRSFEVCCPTCAEGVVLQHRRDAINAETPEARYRRERGRLDTAAKLLKSY